MSVTVSSARRRARVACATALIGAACVAPTDASPVDATATDPNLVRSVATSTPAIFAPDVISDDNEQWRITFTPDGKTAYFAESPEFFPFTRQATIYVSTLVNGAWTEPVVAPFSGQYSDIDPFLSPNGQRLYFSSIRPVDGVTRGDIDLWMVERTPDGWSEPIRLGPRSTARTTSSTRRHQRRARCISRAVRCSRSRAGTGTSTARSAAVTGSRLVRRSGRASTRRRQRPTSACRTRGNSIPRSQSTERRFCSRRFVAAASASATSTSATS